MLGGVESIEVSLIAKRYGLAHFYHPSQRVCNEPLLYVD